VRKVGDDEVREAQAEVLLTIGRAAKILTRTLPDDCEVKVYFEEWTPKAAQWAGRLILQSPPLRAADQADHPD
jgi:hypothetical protein